MKKNYKKIPDFVQAKLNNIRNNNIIVAAVKRYTASEIQDGVLKSFGIHSEKDLEISTPILPTEERGRYSKVNVLGKTVTRRDLPKVLKTIDCGSRPIFGDYTKGSFTLYVTRPVYQKEFFEPKKVTFMIHLIKINEVGGEMSYTFKIVAGNILQKAASNFEQQLFFNLNLLQENFGTVNVFDAEATIDEYLNTVSVDWEILPVGSSDDILRQITSRFRNSSPELINTIQERYQFLYELGAKKIILCDTGLKRYFGAMFLENLVVFENMSYGNAIYIMFDNWKDLSKLSRTELLNEHQGSFIRVLHSDNWKKRIQTELNFRLGRND